MVAEEEQKHNGKEVSEICPLSRKEEERIFLLRRQRWAESKILEEAVARKLEKYLQDSLAKLLEARKDQFEEEIRKRVHEGVEKIEARRRLEEEEKEREAKQAIARRKEEEKVQRELSERLEKEREQGLEEARRKEEAERVLKYQQELRILEEKQKKEVEEQKRIKREQEIILNRKHIRAKLSFSLKK
ncbi:arginine and glutamate rich 1 [Cichlidogyrus casuarinus]|uniref:Arginine and glutamate rich 1 n=1 Tax=Cichlidogyrus casuarinus TaxID=1844966 RepID=A0ABD2PWX3_9PLAT